jgi:uncharacterized damage-inducible protein DinB
MEETKKVLIMMAGYHRWAYEQLFASLQKIPDEFYFDQSVKLFFGSIHRNLNHLCLVDRLWQGRFIGQPLLVQSLDQEIYKTRNELQQAILEGAAQWIDYVKQAPLEELNMPKI